MKYADQTDMRMRRLVCAFIVRTCLATRPNYNLKTTVSILMSLFLRINGVMRHARIQNVFVIGGPALAVFFCCFFFFFFFFFFVFFFWGGGGGG